MKIVKYILSILKDFTSGLFQGVFLMIFCGVIAIPLLFLLMLLPSFLANATNSIIVFILAFIGEIILIDLLLDGQSDIVDYFINKWKEIR